MKFLIASDIHGSAYYCDLLLKEIEKEKKKQEKIENEKQEPEENISTEENKPDPYKKVDLYLIPEIYKRFFNKKDEDERTE